MQIVLFILIIALLCYCCFKGVPTPISGLICGTLMLLVMGMPITDGLTETYMGGFINFVKPYWMLLLFGSIFGKLIEISGAADSIAQAVLKLTGLKYVLIGMIAVTIILNAGGISIFVCIYAMFPICIKLCKQANLPRKYVLATFGAGCCFASGLPWTPSINNVAPTAYLGTTVSAAWLPGVVSSVIYLIAAIAYIMWCEKRDLKKGRHYEAATVAGSLEDIPDEPDRKYPSVIMSLVPIIVILVVLNVTSIGVNYSILCGCVAAIICLFPYMPHQWADIKRHAGAACTQGMTAIINTSAVVGFGAIVQTTPVFANMMTAVTNLSVSPLLGAFVTTTALAGICGSSSSGISMASPILAEYFAPLYNVEALHRIATVGSLGLDSLPNCGFLQTEYSYAGCSFQEAYPMGFVISVVLTILQALLLVILCPLLGF